MIEPSWKDRNCMMKNAIKHSERSIMRMRLKERLRRSESDKRLN